jgi:hypothetical protein
VSWVRRVNLHPAPLAPKEVALHRDDNPIKRMKILTVAMEHPSILELIRALQDRARELAVVL